jgi:HlyD family secretion protein
VRILGRSRALLALLLLVVALLWGVRSIWREDGATSRAGYDIAEIERGEVVASVSATGTLSPLITVQVGSQVSGSIHRLHADFNSQVRSGDLIAEIEPSLFEAEVAQAEANLRSSEAALGKAGVDVRDKKRQLDRLLKLQEDRVVSESDLDVARFAYEAALMEQKAAEAALGQRRAELERTQVNLAHTRIYAPIDGIVMSRDVDVGQTVAASLQAPTLFTIARDLAQMQIETEVDEAFIGRIHEGQPVSFRVFAYPDRVFAGELAQVRLNPKVESGVVLYNCVIHVDNGDLALKPGMTATVTVEVERRENTLKVLNAALRYVPDPLPEGTERLRGELGQGEAILWSPGRDGLRPFTVQTGLAGEKATEVRGEHIEEGLEVAVPETRKDRSLGNHHRGWRLF